MRALRKIVFINSANIRYAEIKLDGNVHFIGTQGVGKSTLLRAILFFYNADKLHLGIPKEMKSFDDFYLPNPNSYIVYEVEHEHRPFTVLVFRSSGRACYRFIDAPFERKWLVDEFGDVTSEYKVINSRLDKNIYMRKGTSCEYKQGNPPVCSTPCLECKSCLGVLEGYGVICKRRLIEASVSLPDDE